MARAAAEPGYFDKETVQLEQLEPNLFRLLDESLIFTDSNGRPHKITREEINAEGTDLASVPSMLWWFVASYGRQTRAALIHDTLVRRPDTDTFKRKDADWVFRDALWASKVPVLRRGLMWAAVSLETTFLTHFGSRNRTWAIRLAQFAAMVAALYFCYLGGEWFSWSAPWVSARLLIVIAMVAGLVASLKRAGVALLVDQIALIAGTFGLWWAGERPTWQLVLFAVSAASWLLWWRRALWMIFGLAVFAPAVVIVLVVRYLIGSLEYAATPISNLRRWIFWEASGGDEEDVKVEPGKTPRKRPVKFKREKTQGAYQPTREI